MADGTETGSGPELDPQFHTPPDYGRAGRNLPVAIAVGVLLGGLLLVTLFLVPWAFALLVGAALALGTIEVSHALRRVGMRPATVPVVVGTIAIVTGSYFAGLADASGAEGPAVQIPSNTVMLAMLGLTTLAALVWRMPRGAEGYAKDAAGSVFLIGYIPLLGSFAGLMLSGDRGSMRVMTFIAVIVASDTCGYAIGVLFGKHQMAPRISPKKTWEGFVGALVGGTVVAVLMMVLALGVPLWTGLVLGPALVVTGACGDLIESLIKRDVGIKDMSSVLPGHGGVMDRLDSLLVGAPVAWLVLFLLVPGG